jgi:DNA helicase-2/ATP-dependent DNA helicase PcrA
LVRHLPQHWRTAAAHHAIAIGLAESFTILDRGDGEDLMNLIRQELGFATKAKRFPLKGTCVANG